jgi:N-acetylglucosaminyldiphosphoundecaprenol N-acetyl-beta-D-mannosaminyltransferase
MDTKLFGVRNGSRVLGAVIDSLDWKQVLEIVGKWAQTRQSRYVCLCNVHAVVTARLQPDVGYALRKSDIALPDGMPIAWMLRLHGFNNQRRINGPDFMWRFCSDLQKQDISVYLYGSQQSTLDALCSNLKMGFSRLRIVGTISPPYRRLTPDEDDAVVNGINASGASVVFVSLGCPKQELWMAEHRDRIRAVMVGVGAAFDYHAGTLKRADPWMQEWGLVWAYRLMREPRRLWARYLVTNSVFVSYAVVQLAISAMRRRRTLVAAPAHADLLNEGEH